MFTELPAGVLSDLLSLWLHVKDVANLDSACCRKSTREEYLQLCQRKEFSFVLSNNFQSLALPWLLVRRFHVDTIHVTADMSAARLAQILSITGYQMRSVTVSNHQAESTVAAIISMLVLKCPKMTVLHFIACSFDFALFDLLAASCGLLDFKLDRCSLTGNLLSQDEASCLKRVCKGFVTTPTVEHGPNSIDQLTRLFPALMSLQLHCEILTDQNLIQIVDKCPHVKLCTLHACSMVTEASVKIAVSRWGLETLTVRSCGMCSDDLLQTIVSSCPTLHAFQFRSTNSFTHNAFAVLLRGCTRLTNVALGWHPVSPQEFVTIFAPALGQIEVLVLAQNLCCDTVLKAVGQYCVRLRILNMVDDPLGNYIISGAGLVCVLRLCVELRRLVVAFSVQNAHFGSALIQNMLQSLRPNLIIVHSDYVYT